MIYNAFPARVILESPDEYKAPDVPAMCWKGIQFAVENGCVRHMMSCNAFDYLKIGPGTRI